ncbi:MAG: rRNA pseudouridine synthase [Tannerella sp.]|jgi:23S rRNA pseudouridine2605 synthase|nr:rRNA pseudouridine synthase [Tannerella sp.]
MESIERNDLKATESGVETGQRDFNADDSEQGDKPKKRLRIKETRKIDYNRSTSESRPYQPMLGQTRLSTASYQPRPYPQDEGSEETEYNRPRTDDSSSGRGERYNRPEGYQPRRIFSSGGGGGEQGGRSYEEGYQPRRSSEHTERSGGSYQERGGYQDRGNYQPRSNYQERGGDRPSYNRQGGYQQNRPQQSGYQGAQRRPQQGGYQERGGGYQGGGDRGGYQDRGSQGGYQGGSDRGGYQDRGSQGGGGYNRQGGYKQNKPGNGPSFHNKFQPNDKRPRYTKPMPKPIKYDEIIADISAPIRLNKFLANAGVCSRREADEFIQAGAVKVNDKVIIELGTKITRLDTVAFQNQEVKIESKIYIALNKPKNCVTTSEDPQNRQTVMDLVKNACSERIYPVGRLDRNTTGVLLLTNDGEMAAKLTHPSFKKKKIYHVWLDHEVTIEDMQKLADGIQLEDGEMHADAISYANEEDHSQVGIEIHSGKNRIVRRMFELIGYHVTNLDRVYFAGLTKQNLNRGRWRYLTEPEVNALRMGAYE